MLPTVANYDNWGPFYKTVDFNPGMDKLFNPL